MNMNSSLDQIIDSYLCNADLSGGETPEQIADALLAVMPWTGDDYSADTVRTELIDTIEHRQAAMTKQPMSHETAMFASFFTAPEGQDELEYLREAQDALDTTQTGALAAYGALQNRIVAVSESRLTAEERAEYEALLAR